MKNSKPAAIKDFYTDIEALKQVMDLSPGHIYWKDRDGVMLGCNLKTAQSLGFNSIEEVVGKSDFELLGHDSSTEVRKNDLEVINTGNAIVVKEAGKLLGKDHVFLSHKTPLRNTDSEIIGILGVSLDITEQEEIVRTLNSQQAQKSYVASLGGIPKEDKDFLKSKTCIMVISVGQEYHEGAKFKATLEMVNSRFKECTIAVCDTLQRHTLCIPKDSDYNTSKLYDLSKSLGDEWIQRNEAVIQTQLKIPSRCVRWDEWFKTARFEEDFKRVKRQYETNEGYKAAIVEVVNTFVERNSKRTPGADKKKFFNHSLEYILEECACMLQWFDGAYDYEVYNAPRSKALAATFAMFEQEKSTYLLRPTVIEFTSIASNKEELNNNKIALDNIVETLPGHVYWKDKNGMYSGCNLKQAQSFNLHDVKSVLGKSDFDLLDYDIALAIRKNDLEVMSAGRTCVREEAAEFLGKRSTFLSYKTPIKNSHSAVIGIVGVSLDITKQKEAEQRLIEKNQLLKEAIKAKRDFLNNISHEIRTPLSCILKMSNLLYEDWEKYPNNEARKAHLKMAVDGNNRLQSVLLNLLDLSKVNAEKMQYEKIPYSLARSTEDVVREFIDQKHRIHLDYNKTEDFNCLYDHFRIEQVIRNLLANAISYGGEGDITVTLSREEGLLKFNIKDQGIGVPEDELLCIFKIFTQSSITKSGAGGSGIGLSICQTIIEGHGGRIWAENNQDIGSNFTFELPLPKEQIIFDVQKQDYVPSTKFDPNKKKPVVLVIDDEQTILDVSSLVLSSIGFEVITANSGEMGVEILKEIADKIDVVLLDMMMPAAPGLEILKIIKADEKLRDIPIYIHSGMSDGDEVEEALALGALGFISKTSSRDSIAKILSEFLK
ncbi:MAG: ATP-binding protein [Pseudomonadota bacterium]